MAIEPARTRPEDKFITAKEAATFLKVSVETVYDWTKKRRKFGMPFRKFGRTVRIPRKEFMLWLEGPQ